MASPLDIKLILCDAAQADPNGKIHMLGAGWSVTATPTTPQAVAILIKVPGDRAEQQISGTLRLLDADGQAVEVETSSGKKEPIENEFALEVGRPPGLEHDRSGARQDDRRGDGLEHRAHAAAAGPLPVAPRYEQPERDRLVHGDELLNQCPTRPELRGRGG
jgi:hypothetical protein